MEVREFTANDLRRIEELHRNSGYEYVLPPVLSDQSFFSRRIVGDAEDVAAAAFLRLTAEPYLIVNPNWRTPAWRMEALRKIHEACRQDAIRKGVGEVTAFLPPQVEKRFGKRLLRMGWKHYVGPEWRAFSYEVNPDG